MSGSQAQKPLVWLRKIAVEKRLADFISAQISTHAAPAAVFPIMTTFHFLTLTSACLALVACEGMKNSSSSSDPYASNYGNDGHYNPYPGQTGYAAPSTPSYQTPPAAPTPPPDPYAFSSGNKTQSSASSSTSSSRKSTASSSSSKKKSTRSKSSGRKSSSGSRYAVTKGDTLYGIARKKGTTVAKLKAANGLKSDLIRPGQSLKIP